MVRTEELDGDGDDFFKEVIGPHLLPFSQRFDRRVVVCLAVLHAIRFINFCKENAQSAQAFHRLAVAKEHERRVTSECNAILFG